MKTPDKISESNPFRIPENYFEDAKRKILSATVERNEIVKKTSSFSAARPFLLAAASVALLCILGYTGMKLIEHGKKSRHQSFLTEEIYPESAIGEIDLTILEDEAIVSGFPGKEEKDLKKEIIDYLEFENIDINEIHEQL